VGRLFAGMAGGTRRRPSRGVAHRSGLTGPIRSGRPGRSASRTKMAERRGFPRLYGMAQLAVGRVLPLLLMHLRFADVAFAAALDLIAAVRGSGCGRTGRFTVNIPGGSPVFGCVTLTA
jgi:hypothetical protein